MQPNLTKPVAVSQMSPRRLPDDSQTSPRRLPDVSPTSPRRLPDDSQTTPRRLPDDSRTTPGRLPDDSQTSPRPLPDHSQTTPRRLPDVSPTSPRRLGDVCRVYSTVYCARGEQSVWAVTNRTDLHPRLLRPPHISIISHCEPNDVLEQYFQRFSVSLHFANVRAILRRAPAPPPATTAIAAAHSALARAEAQRSAGPMCLDPP